jgi:hypothetical protein
MEVGEAINDEEFEKVYTGLRGITRQRQELSERTRTTQRWFEENRGTLAMKYRQDHLEEVDYNLRILVENSSESGPLSEQVHKVDTALSPLLDG